METLIISILMILGKYNFLLYVRFTNSILNFFFFFCLFCRVSALLSTLHIMELYAKLYNSTSAFIELFNCVSELLSNYPLDKFSESIKVFYFIKKIFFFNKK